mgnify:FL=1
MSSSLTKNRLHIDALYTVFERGGLWLTPFGSPITRVLSRVSVSISGESILQMGI